MGVRTRYSGRWCAGSSSPSSLPLGSTLSSVLIIPGPSAPPPPFPTDRSGFCELHSLEED